MLPAKDDREGRSTTSWRDWNASCSAGGVPCCFEDRVSVPVNFESIVMVVAVLR
jgi:hypothetical protein